MEEGERGCLSVSCILKRFSLYIYIGKLNVILMFISDSVYVAGLQTGTPCFEALQ